MESKPEAKDIVSSKAILEPFVYEKDGKLIVFICKSDNYTMKCPSCRMETR